MNLDRRIVWYVGLLVLTSIYYALPWRSHSTLAAIAGVPFVLLYTVFIPGVALDRLLNRGQRDVLERITVWAFDGLAILLLCAFVWALTGVGLSVFGRILPAVIVALAAAAAARRPGAVSPGVPAPIGGVSAGWTVGAYAVFVAAMALLVLVAGPPVDYGKDTLDYVAYTNEVAETGDPFPTTAFYLDPGPDGADLRKGLLHSVYGYYKFYLGIDALVLFRALGAALLALVLLAVYTVTWRFFGNRAVAALAGVLFVIGFDGGLRSDLIRSFFYPNRIGLGYLLLFLSAALPVLVRPRPRQLVLCAAYAFAAAAVHIQYTVMVGFAVLTMLVWKTCFDTGSLRSHLGRSMIIGAATFMGMLPYAAFRYLTAYRASDLHREIQGSVFITDRLFVAEPIVAWQSMGFLGAASLLAIVPLWSRRRSNPALGYLIASFLTLIVIQFNPLFMPVVFQAITYLVFRLGIICPFYILAAYFVLTGWRPAPLGESWGPLRGIALAAVLVAVVGGLGPVFGDNAFSPQTLRAEREKSHLGWQKGLDFLNQLPERAVIASDPVTSYSISAFTPHYVVCTFDQHAPPNDLLSRERTIAARDILSPFTSASDKANLSANLQVTHVVVNEKLGANELSDYWTVSGVTAPLIVRRFQLLEGLFEAEDGGSDGGFRVFRWTGKMPRHVEAIFNPLLRTTLPVGATPVGETAGLARCDAAEIRRAGPGGRGKRSVSAIPHSLVTVEPGQEIEVSLFWSLDRELPPDKYIVAVRFDRAELDLPFGGWPSPKIVRKITERLRGERYRFRQDHRIADGFHDPDLWPRDYHVLDMATIRIPKDLANGRYIVRAKLLKRSTLPNKPLHDFFYDDDVYHGVRIGEIEVQAR